MSTPKRNEADELIKVHCTQIAFILNNNKSIDLTPCSIHSDQKAHENNHLLFNRLYNMLRMKCHQVYQIAKTKYLSYYGICMINDRQEVNSALVTRFFEWITKQTRCFCGLNKELRKVSVKSGVIAVFFESILNASIDVNE